MQCLSGVLHALFGHISHVVVVCKHVFSARQLLEFFKQQKLCMFRNWILIEFSGCMSNVDHNCPIETTCLASFSIENVWLQNIFGNIALPRPFIQIRFSYVLIFLGVLCSHDVNLTSGRVHVLPKLHIQYSFSVALAMLVRHVQGPISENQCLRAIFG